MNTKIEHKTNKLIASMKERTQWNLARVKFLVAFISSVCKLQTVNFQKLSQGLGGTVQVESNLRKIQRFFAEFPLDGDLIAKIIFLCFQVNHHIDYALTGLTGNLVLLTSIY